MRDAHLPRKHPFHPPWIVWPRDLANIVILASCVSITIDLLPGHDATGFLKERKRPRPKALPQTVLAEVLPARLAQALTAAHLPSGEMANIPDRTLAGLAEQLNGWQFTPHQTEGFAKAEVTVGGIDTRDLSSKTMEARNVGGLYVIGEAVDVTGWLGGYNFQWAWALRRYLLIFAPGQAVPL